MSSIDSPTLTPRSRSRRRLAAWLAFGVVGLAIGAVWATGFTSFTGLADATPGESPAMLKGAPDPDTDSLAGKAAKVGDLQFNFDGRWGSIAANTVTVKVDLSTLDAAKRYNVAVLLANTSVLTDWASMRLKFENAYKASGAACLPGDFTGSAHAEILNFDNEDAGVYWNDLPGDAVYCIGVSAATGDDVAGTFLRSATDTAPTHFPSFITTVDRAL